jgi:hypothetical protein
MQRWDSRTLVATVLLITTVSGVLAADIPPERCVAASDEERQIDQLLISVKDVVRGRQAPLPCLQLYRSVQERPHQNPKIAIAVAISGGGHRAANFAAGVMMGLEKVAYYGDHLNVLREVDYFSSVSGGGLAVGSYLSSWHDHVASAREPTAVATYSLYSNWSEIAPALRYNFQRSLYRAAIEPGLSRAHHLERRLDDVVLKHGHRGRSLLLGDIFKPDCRIPDVKFNSVACAASSSATVVLPYWFANATIESNGAIFPFSPDMLALYNVHGYAHRAKQVEITDPYAVPVSIGMTASATFPVAIPATVVETDDYSTTPQRSSYLHLLDGGLADNLAVLTAIRALQLDPARTKILIVVDAYAGAYESASRRRRPLWAPAVAHRALTISLDSWRGRHRTLIEAITGPLGWKVVYLSFDELLDAPDDETTDERLVPAQQYGKDRQLLYESVRRIQTKLQMSVGEQELLLKAGRQVVRTRLAEICDAMKCEERADSPEQ